MRKTLSALVLASVLPVSVSWAAGPIDFNGDFRNLGPATAYDIALVLAGDEIIDGTYNGVAPYLHFRNFCQTTDGSTTTLHWQAPWNDATGAPGAITPGTTIHVGYGTPDNTSEIIDAYWTDQAGGRIPGAGIAITGGHIDQTGVTISNSLRSRISVSNVRYNHFSTRLPLGELVGANQALMSALSPLAGPATVTLDPGQSVRFNFASPVPEGNAAVVVFDVGTPGSVSNALSFSQAVP